MRTLKCQKMLPQRSTYIKANSQTLTFTHCLNWSCGFFCVYSCLWRELSCTGLLFRKVHKGFTQYYMEACIEKEKILFTWFKLLQQETIFFTTLAVINSHFHVSLQPAVIANMSKSSLWWLRGNAPLSRVWDVSTAAAGPVAALLFSWRWSFRHLISL